MEKQEIKNKELLLLTEAFYLSAWINMNTSMCVFLDMSGHIDHIQIRIRESKQNYQKELAETEFTYGTEEQELHGYNFRKYSTSQLEKISEKVEILRTIARDRLISTEYMKPITEIVRYEF